MSICLVLPCQLRVCAGEAKEGRLERTASANSWLNLLKSSSRPPVASAKQARRERTMLKSAPLMVNQI
jgi:hypothetical protein